MESSLGQVRGSDLPGAVNVIPEGLGEKIANRGVREQEKENEIPVALNGKEEDHRDSANEINPNLQSTLQSAITEIEQGINDKEFNESPAREGQSEEKHEDALTSEQHESQHEREEELDPVIATDSIEAEPIAIALEETPAPQEQSEASQPSVRLRLPHEFKGKPRPISLPPDAIQFEPMKLPEVGKEPRKMFQPIENNMQEQFGGDSMVIQQQQQFSSEMKSQSQGSIPFQKAMMQGAEMQNGENGYGSLKRRNPREMFIDSAFYSPKHHPSVAEQVEMAHRLSSSLYDEGNKLSKGQEMYLKRAKKSGKWVHRQNQALNTDFDLGSDAEEIPRHDKVPNLKLVMNPEGKCHDWTDLPEDELPEMQVLAAGGKSPDTAHHVVENLQSCKGKGGELFAKRKKRSDKWVVDENTLGESQPSQYAEKFIQKQSRQQEQIIQEKQQEFQRKVEEQKRLKEEALKNRAESQIQQTQTFHQQQSFKQQQSMDIKFQQQAQSSQIQERLAPQLLPGDVLPPWEQDRQQQILEEQKQEQLRQEQQNKIQQQQMQQARQAQNQRQVPPAQQKMPQTRQPQNPRQMPPVQQGRQPQVKQIPAAFQQSGQQQFQQQAQQTQQVQCQTQQLQQQQWQQQQIVSQQPQIQPTTSSSIPLPSEPVSLPPSVAPCSLKGEQFVPTFDKSIRNAQGIDVWKNTGPKPWNEMGFNSLPRNMKPHAQSTPTSLLENKMDLGNANRMKAFAPETDQDMLEYDCSVKYEQKQSMEEEADVKGQAPAVPEQDVLVETSVQMSANEIKHQESYASIKSNGLEHNLSMQSIASNQQNGIQAAEQQQPSPMTKSPSVQNSLQSEPIHTPLQESMSSEQLEKRPDEPQPEQQPEELSQNEQPQLLQEELPSVQSAQNEVTEQPPPTTEETTLEDVVPQDIAEQNIPIAEPEPIVQHSGSSASLQQSPAEASVQPSASQSSLQQPPITEQEQVIQPSESFSAPPQPSVVEQEPAIQQSQSFTSTLQQPSFFAQQKSSSSFTQQSSSVIVNGFAPVQSLPFSQTNGMQQQFNNNESFTQQPAVPLQVTSGGMMHSNDNRIGQSRAEELASSLRPTSTGAAIRSQENVTFSSSSKKSVDTAESYVTSLKPTNFGEHLKQTGSLPLHQNQKPVEIEDYTTSLRHTDIGHAIRESGAFEVNRTAQQEAEENDGEKRGVRNLVQRFRQQERASRNERPPMPFTGSPTRLRSRSLQRPPRAPYQEQQMPMPSSQPEPEPFVPIQSSNRNSMVDCLMLDGNQFSFGGSMTDPSAILGVSDSSEMQSNRCVRSGSDGAWRSEAEKEKWDNHNAIARGWKDVRESYHPVTFRKLYGVKN